MRPSRSLPLLVGCAPKVYLFDTSAWLNIDSHPKSDRIWARITELADEGRLCTCLQVIGELRDNPIFQTRIKPMEQKLVDGDADGGDIAFLQAVGRITHDFPSMSKATGTKTPADPYVVALALME